MKGLPYSMRAQAKTVLRRRRVELVLPRRRGAAALRHARIRRFRLPPEVEATRGAAGPDTVLVDTDRMVNRALFRFGAGSWHPFVAALVEQVDRPDLPDEESVLTHFYERFQPDTVHDVLLGDRATRRIVANWPAVDLLLDVWSATDRLVAHIRSRVARDDRPGPSQYLGPNTVRHGREHLDRVRRIHTSIRDTGYRPGDFPDGVPTGYFLVDGEDYRFVLGHGNHRMAALTVLGIRRVPVRLRPPHPPVIARDDLRRWTVDGGGLYSMAEATALFDSYFIDDGMDRARALGLV